MAPPLDPTPTPPYPITLPDDIKDTAYADLDPLWQRRVYRAVRNQALFAARRTVAQPPPQTATP